MNNVLITFGEHTGKLGTHDGKQEHSNWQRVIIDNDAVLMNEDEYVWVHSPTVEANGLNPLQ